MSHGLSGASQIVCGALPSTPTRFIFPAAKKSSERLSGDQKGFEAPWPTLSPSPKRATNQLSRVYSAANLQEGFDSMVKKLVLGLT